MEDKIALNKKFGQLFIRYEYNGNRVPCPTDKDGLLKLMKAVHIDEDALRRFENYVDGRVVRYGDNVEKWFNSLENFEDLPYEDLAFYNLPSEQKIYSIGPEYVFVQRLYKYASDFMNNCNVRVSDDIITRYRFWRGGITVEYAMRKGLGDSEKKNLVLDEWKKFIDRFGKQVDKFNDEMKENGSIYRMAKCSPITFTEEHNGRTFNGKSLALTASIDVYCDDKTPPDPKYVNQIFGIINEEQIKP